MTPEEREIVLELGLIWAKFLSLPTEHNDDMAEFRHGVHFLQSMVLMREGRRNINKQLKADYIKSLGIEDDGA